MKQVRALYTGLFSVHLHSIRQGMILDVQPLVKSPFREAKLSHTEFFVLDASALNPTPPPMVLGYLFWGWGWGM